MTLSLGLLTGCAGVSANTSAAQQNSSGGQLSVSPATLSFGNVAVGSSSSLTGTLTANNADVALSSASWSGSGYAITGITFPVTVSSGKSVSYTVSFTPASAGSAPGNISFVSDASNSPVTETFTGTGTQLSSHSVDLSWNASTSVVAGYNLYRGTQPGGPFSKLNSSLLPGTSFTDAAVLSGTTYYYLATAVDANNLESAYSNQASAVIP